MSSARMKWLCQSGSWVCIPVIGSEAASDKVVGSPQIRYQCGITMHDVRQRQRIPGLNQKQVVGCR